MSPSISFLELRLSGDALFASLGSGTAAEVLARVVPQPHVWICMQDSPVSTWRARAGTVEVASDTLLFRPLDAFESRGASIGLLIRSAYLVPRVGVDRRRYRQRFSRAAEQWFELQTDGLADCSAACVWEGLAVAQDDDQDRLFMKWSVPEINVDQVLERLADLPIV